MRNAESKLTRLNQDYGAGAQAILDGAGAWNLGYSSSELHK